MHGLAVDRALEPGDERVDARLVGLRLARRRHEPAAQLAHGGFEDLRLERHRVGPHALEHEAAGGFGGVMTFDAVRLDHRPLLFAARAEQVGVQDDGGDATGNGQRSGAGNEDAGRGHKGLFIKECLGAVQPLGQF